MRSVKSLANPLARCVVPRYQTATDLPWPKARDKDTLSASGNMPGDVKSAEPNQSVCVRVCVCAP